MSSHPIETLREEIHRVRRRRNGILHMRQIGRSLVALIGLLIVLGTLVMFFQFPPHVRVLLFFILWIGAGAIVGRHLHVVRRFRSDERRLAHYVEDHIPDLEQRLLTSMECLEKEGIESPSQLVESLWDDTVVHIRDRNIQRVTTARPAWVAASTAGMMICMLLLAFWAWRPFSRATQTVLWPWQAQEAAVSPSAAFTVSPGDTQIRRGGDVTVMAQVDNALPERVDLYLQTGAADWAHVKMWIEGSRPVYRYHISSISADMTYYVDIGTDRSRKYRITVFDPPRVEQIDVDYLYPTYTGLKNKTERNGGDIIAPEGTQVVLRATFNRPIQRGLLKFDDGSTVDLDPSGNQATGTFVITQDGTYLVEAVDQEGQRNEKPIEYVIRSIPDSPPEVALTRPGRDTKVMSLEEVSIAATARDDYGLKKFTLHYSVAGGSEQEVHFLGEAESGGTVTVDGKTVIYFEDLNMAPGDFVTYYVKAMDNKGTLNDSESMSDIYFLEVIPTEEEFRRAPQQAGGGGQPGQGGRSSALVETQKNIITATWKLLNRKAIMTRDKFAEDVTVVAESQRMVMQRAQMSLSRLMERLSFSDESYDRAVNHLKEAVKHMESAAEHLFAERLKEALGPEQAALKAILKAESESRRTEIQMVRNRGGAAGGAEQFREREDLRELFEMEMGRLENRYEMPRQASGQPPNPGQEDALMKLRQLAQRQERLNRAQEDYERRKNFMNEEEKRRRLEELRREQETLNRQASDLSRRWSRLERGNTAPASVRSLDQAIEEMREAAHELQNEDTGSAAERGRRALERLRDQEQRIRRRRGATVSELARILGKKAEELTALERQIVEKVEALENEQGRGTSTAEIQSSKGMKDTLEDKEKLKRELGDVEDTLWTLGARAKEDDPELARRALDALRSFKSEEIGQRVAQSERNLRDGLIGPSLEMERGIEQSINRFSTRLRDLDPLIPKSTDQRIEAAFENAVALRQELERLQQQMEALRARQRNAMLRGGDPSQQQRGAGGDRAGDLGAMRESLERSRRYAQGLLQPWAPGERWAVDARSIHRELTRQEIEDFLRQPDLWKPLLEPVRELESALRAQAEVRLYQDKAFSAPEQEPPAPYQSLVEAYYRALSETTDGKP